MNAPSSAANNAVVVITFGYLMNNEPPVSSNAADNPTRTAKSLAFSNESPIASMFLAYAFDTVPTNNASSVANNAVDQIRFLFIKNKPPPISIVTAEIPTSSANSSAPSSTLENLDATVYVATIVITNKPNVLANELIASGIPSISINVPPMRSVPAETTTIVIMSRAAS